MMPLTKCPDCGRDVSTEAVACPGCGRPVAKPAPAATPKKRSRAGFIVALILAPIFTLVLLAGIFAALDNSHSGSVAIARPTPSEAEAEAERIGLPNAIALFEEGNNYAFMPYGLTFSEEKKAILDHASRQDREIISKGDLLSHGMRMEIVDAGFALYHRKYEVR